MRPAAPRSPTLTGPASTGLPAATARRAGGDTDKEQVPARASLGSNTSDHGDGRCAAASSTAADATVAAADAAAATVTPLPSSDTPPPARRTALGHLTMTGMVVQFAYFAAACVLPAPRRAAPLTSSGAASRDCTGPASPSRSVDRLRAVVWR